MNTTRAFASTSVPGVAAGLALALVSAFVLLAPGAADATATASDGSDWGSQGKLSSDSAVTLRWDNTDNPAGSVVPRDSRQALPHTDGKTYASVSKSIRDAYAAAFGAGNGLGGLQVSVSQTRDLVNQAVTVEVSGGTGGTAVPGSGMASYVQVFQCWGAMGADGKPDSEAADPDPATCQTGAGGADWVSMTRQEDRFVGGDAALLKGGDWSTYAQAAATGRQDPPFLTVSGDEDGSVLNQKSTYFNATTTNELSHATLDGRGAAQRSFEMQTGSEAPGLGCGYRTDAASTRTCWLVIVPRLALNTIADSQMGPISPSIWGQRLQVPLTFQDVPTACPNGRARALIAGSEMARSAFASWTPGVCEKEKLTLGYSTVPDSVARTQYAGGGSDAILTSEPMASTQRAVYVPVALTAPVIGYTLDYKPECVASASLAIADVATEAAARKCGYDSLADLTTDRAKSGSLVRDLRLTPLLIAKLLTQSYGWASMDEQLPWLVHAPVSLFADPQFTALNPQLHLGRFGGNGDKRLASSLLVEASRSDAASQLWNWLLADPAASSFLAGCPDAEGMAINPFYSARTYTSCRSQATALESAAAAARKATSKPDGYVDLAVSYPPEGSPYPLPEWYDGGHPAGARSKTETDWLPRDDSMAITARNTFNGGKKAATQWCATSVDDSCQPSPGKWVAPSGKIAFGDRQAFTVTDASSAARYRLPTATLCDDDGRHCVGATTASLRVAADQFERSSVSNVRSPGDADLADGAYPLTMPVYAAVRPTLDAATRTAYADALTFLTGTGQTAGLQVGDLPPGYAPLTKTLAKDAVDAIAALRAGLPTTAVSPSATPSTSTTAPSTTPTSGAGTGPNPGGTGITVPEGTTPGVTTVAAPGPATVTPGALVPTAAGTETWPKYTLPLGLAIALWCGLFGPLMRTRARFRVSR
ncbi:hypothetical protein [Nocardioides sp.]|uniref:hypothetical protein n=1 Tax=Nocardioides sp. TaxID=35761 RepID=UPI00261131FC|nr:hypothetical protein [Nocardioides sp.]